jgi:hypothetical protein
MILSGSVLLLREVAGARIAFDGRYAALGVAGGLVCLYVFMTDALAALGGGPDALRTLQPTAFPWPLFLLGYAALAAGFLGSALAGSDRPDTINPVPTESSRAAVGLRGDVSPRLGTAAEPGSTRRRDRAAEPS